MTADRTPAMGEERVEKLARLLADELDALGPGQRVGSMTHIPRYVTGPELAAAIRRALARLDGGA